MVKKVLLSLLIIVAVLTVSLGGGLWYYLNKIPREAVESIDVTNQDLELMEEYGIPTSTNSLGTSEEVLNKLAKYDGSISNILLLGIDSTDGVGRSDSMIILTVDKTTKKMG